MKPRRRTTAEMPGSTMKVCVSCMQHIRVACKICRLCGAPQIMKKGVLKAKEKANKEWGEKLQKGGNADKLVDAAHILIEQFQMAGFHPLLLFGRAKTNSICCDYLSGLEVVTGQEITTVQTIQGLYESLLKVIVKRENTVKKVSGVDLEGQTEALEDDGTFTPCETPVMDLKQTSSSGPPPTPSTSSTLVSPTPTCPPARHSVLPSAVRKVIVGEEDQQEDWSSGGLDQEDPGLPHIKEDQQEDWTSGLDQEDPEPPHIKQDQQEDWSSGLDHMEDSGGPGSAPGDSFGRYTLVRGDWQETRDPQSALRTSQDPDLRPRAGDKPFSCSECEKRFTERRTLRRHMRIHTGAKPYSCYACDKTFSWRESLRNHMLSHTGEKPHSCPVCHKSFTANGTLRRHMLSHTGEKPHSCSVCEKSFTLSAPLRRHMLTHTGEKPHSCSVCHKSFTQSSNLRSHMLTHTGEKPHRCSACGKGFRAKKVLDEHVNVCGKVSATTLKDDGGAATLETKNNNNSIITGGENEAAIDQDGVRK